MRTGDRTKRRRWDASLAIGSTMAVLLLGAALAPAQPAGDAGGVHDLLVSARDEHSLPALAAAVVRGDRVVAADAVGVRVVGSRTGVDLADRFHIASCTKSFTATLAAMLVEEGKLSWSSAIGDGVPELKGQVREEYLNIRLDQLLSHTAGIAPYTSFGPDRLRELMAFPGTGQEQRLRFVTEVLNEPPAAKPGEKELYSNAGYAAAAVMIERAAGKPWEELMRDRIFKPLEMTSATFGWPASSVNPNQPRGHALAADEKTLEPQPLDDSYQLPPCLWPAGAVSCSIEDLARYAGEHLAGLKGRGRLLKQGSYERLHATWNGKPDGFTLGWGRRVDPDYGVVHYGAGSGGTFFVRIWIAPDADLAIVTATNSGTGGEATKEAIERLARAHR